MSTIEHQSSLKREQTHPDDNFASPIKKFCCTLCELGFSKKKDLTNHFKFCKDLEDPADKQGAGSNKMSPLKIKDTAIKSEPCDEELQDTEMFDEPTNVIKYEEVEISETTISGSASRLSEDLKTETPEQPSMPDCTNRMTQLKKHSKTLRDKPFKCDICDYSGATKAYIAAHMRTHTKVKPFKCGECDYASADRSNLTVHTRTHTKEKPFKCDKCNYASARPTHIKIHMKTHTTQKPFKCDQCCYAGAHRSNLEVHMWSKHTRE